MTTWYVTTGRSLVDSARCWREWSRDGYDLSEVDGLSHAEFLAQCPAWHQALQAWRSQTFVLPNGLDQQKREWAGAVVEAHFRTECWNNGRYRSLPAELATLYWLSHTRGGLRGEDTVVFLTGKSNEEVAWLLVAMAEKLKEENRGFVNVSIQKTEPFALDPLSSRQFNQALGVLIGYLEGEDISRHAGLVVTGGYKALLVGLSLWVGRRMWLTPLVYSHEEVPEKVISIRPPTGNEHSPTVSNENVEIPA